MNDFKCTGRIVNELELKTTKGGKSVLDFRIAIQRIAKNTGQDADFINATAFGDIAKRIYDYLDKGSKSIFSGMICSDNFEKNGETIYTTYFLVTSIELIEYKDKRK